MKSHQPFQEPGLINSSYTVLFHLIILIIAPFLVSAFPPELRSDALVVAIVFPLTLFWFSYCVRQFIEGITVLRVILGGAFVVAALSFINAVNGPLSAGSVPIFYTEVPFFANLLAGLSGAPGLIYAGTVMTYGAYTYISGIALASLLESVYERHGSSFIPSAVRRRLKIFDKQVDRSALLASDRTFVYNQLWGITLCSVLLLIYAALYIWLIVIH